MEVVQIEAKSMLVCNEKQQQQETNNNKKLKSDNINNCQTQEAQVQQVKHQPNLCNSIGTQQSKAAPTTTLSSSTNATINNNLSPVGCKDLELLAKEAQDLKIKTRKLQLEVDEKNEIINVLKDELESIKEQSDKFQRENLQLLKDSKRVKFLQDENDFLQDKLTNVEKLEIEIKRLKEKLNELDFLKLRICELEEDRNKAQEESSKFEDNWKRAEARLTRVKELECELNKWKSFSHELEIDRNSIQNKLLESIEQETKLNSINKQVEDEVKRLKSLIKTYEEQRDEDQASNSLVMSVADLKQLDQQHQKQQSSQQSDIIDQPTTLATDTSIKFELDKQIEKELNEENRILKQKLDEQEVTLSELIETNKAIRGDLEGNKKLISDLRQDLACEKSLALKLTNQLTSFTKQIKNLDKHYFPMHETETAASTKTTAIDGPLTTNDRKLRSQDTSTNSRSIKLNDKSEVNESSRLKSVTSTHPVVEKYQSKQRKDELLCKSDRNKTSKELQSNNSEGKNTDNEARQLVNALNSSKLSALSEESTKNHSQLDNGIKPDAQSIITQVEEETEKLAEDNNKLKNLLSIATIATEQTEAVLKSSACVENKSALELSEQQQQQEIDESCGKGRLLPITDNTARKLCSSPINTSLARDHDRLEPAKKISPSCLIDSEDELGLKRKHVRHGISTNLNSNSNNGNGSNTVRHVTSLSPSSIARSQSSSPSVTVTIGHDSGFQSINHDFNQISPPNVEARTAQLHGESHHQTGVETPLVQPNRSMPIIEQTATTSADRQRRPTTPTQNRDKVPTTREISNPDLEQQQREAGSQRSNSSSSGATKQIAEIAVSGRQQVCSAANRQAKASDQKNLAASLDLSSRVKCVDLPSSTERRSEAVSSKASCDTPALAASTKRAIDDLDQRLFAEAAEKRKPVDNATGENELRSEAQTSVKKQSNSPSAMTSATNSSSRSSNFVRNSLPSRSVNFGHSKSSAYLDRIRATVTATTNTTSSLSSSFNEQTRNVVVCNKQQQAIPEAPRYLLNCMLEHKHSERCFVDTSLSSQLQRSQVIPSSVGGHLNHQQHQHPSRQLNALIDPISQERSMLSMQQQQQHYPPLDTTGLNEQQIAHLASLHRQHYYHHLQHMHQLHQLHHHHQHHLHLHHHRMHHKYQQQQQPAARNGSQTTSHCDDNIKLMQQGNQPATNANVGDVRRARNQVPQPPIYTGGSQFYAPATQLIDQQQQVYANMTANNSINQLNEQQHHQRTRLVSNNISSNSSGQHQHQHLNHQHSTSRSPPNGGRTVSHQAASNQYNLPQIDEVNGLPTIESDERAAIGGKHRNAHVVMTSSTIAQAARHKGGATNGTSGSNKSGTRSDSNNNGSPTSASPSSSSSSSNSSSSNLSPSSASSSSSLNLLLASSTPLNRTVVSHTTTEMNRVRQYSIERELISALPMTATLSRVGSCRSNLPLGGVRGEGDHDSKQTSIANNQMMMRNPAKSHQPPMRTSKILNINQQATVAASVKQPLKVENKQNLDSSRRLSMEGSGLEKLANIRLNDSLAFASLRAPKGTNRNRSLNISNSNNNNSNCSPAKAQTASSSPEKRKQTNGDTGGGKSSVWFEYGCV